MKKLFGPAWLGAWLAGILPTPLFKIGKQTPWYRRSWRQQSPWMAAVLAVPLVVFLVWKGMDLLLPKVRQQEQG
ncbi:MAG TPA: hypothetical protein VFB58_03755 [Chloroflexota bacterium]|nr:hypothetical protein [Chloroflexota bacterium]